MLQWVPSSVLVPKRHCLFKNSKQRHHDIMPDDVNGVVGIKHRKHETSNQQILSSPFSFRVAKHQTKSYLCPLVSETSDMTVDTSTNSALLESHDEKARIFGSERANRKVFNPALFGLPPESGRVRQVIEAAPKLNLMASIFGGGASNNEDEESIIHAPTSEVVRTETRPETRELATTTTQKSFQNSLFSTSNANRLQELVEQRRDINVRTLEADDDDDASEPAIEDQKGTSKSERHDEEMEEDPPPRTKTIQSSISASVPLPEERIIGDGSELSQVTIEIPREFGRQNAAATEDQVEIEQSIQRVFTRHADYVMREFGVLLMQRQENSGTIFPRKRIKALRHAATSIQNAVIDKLDEAGKVWNAAALKEQTGDGEMGLSEAEKSFSYHEVASRCLGRLDIRYRMDQPPFSAEEVVKNRWLMPVIQSLLGESAKLVYCGLIMSFPGSDDQPWHQDGHPLFPETVQDDSLGSDLPPFALNVFVPLTAIDQNMGPTEFWLSSHKESNWKDVHQGLQQESRGIPLSENKNISLIGPTLNKGDVLIYDYRTCHRGTSNTSETTVRPMLYLMYARPWFAEHVNFGTERLFPEDMEATSEAATSTKSSGSSLHSKRSLPLQDKSRGGKRFKP